MRKPPLRPPFALCLGLLAFALTSLNTFADPGLDFFEKKVRPILAANCYECHSARAEKLKGGLRLDSRPGWETGGDSGPAIVPGKPETSLLASVISYENIDLQMPPREKLADEEIKILRQWISLGAPDPRTVAPAGPTKASPKSKVGTDYWSFQPIQRKNPPAPSHPHRVATPIDSFVQHRLSAQALAPSEEADRSTLIRRITFDLTGLAPTPEEIDAFLGDSSEEAFPKVVDRLLQDQRFGQRWARHWFDVARFAESSGGGRALLFPNAWRYRDYVIDSFNRDKPYDQFIREQIAGDLLPSTDPAIRREHLIALGFLAMGPTNYELQDKEVLRMEVVDEQIDTLGRAIMGMTIGCARCHDHFFDPISAQDYYSLAGIFYSTKSLIHSNVSTWTKQKLPPTTDQERRDVLVAKDHQEKVKVLTTALQKHEKALAKAEAKLYTNALVIDDSKAKLQGKWEKSTAVSSWQGANYLHDISTEKGRKSATYRPDVPQDGLYHLHISYSPGPNRATNVPVTVGSSLGSRTVLINQQQKPPIGGLYRDLGRFTFKKGTDTTITIGTEDTEGAVIADAFRLVPAGANAPNKDRTALAEIRTQLSGTRRELAALKKNQPPSRQPRSMGVEEEKAPTNIPVALRGNVHKPGPIVPRGFLTLAKKSIPNPPAIPSDQSGRLQLAHWITSPNHPLTSRVMANRIWQHLMGQGLVRTPDNFGAMGELPSHPDLLDYLAGRFTDDGWSIKTLIREIVLSHTYRQSPHASAEATAIDPENRWFGRMEPTRLDPESLRDTILAISGDLDLKMEGPGMRAGTQSEFGYRFDSPRRSVYLPVFRNQLPDIFEVFDFPDPNLVVGRRTISTLPTQALYLMNSPFLREQSRITATHLIQTHSNPSDRLRAAYRTTLGRIPTPGETNAARQYLEAENHSLDAWTQLQQMLFACIDFRYID